jgi:LmbE family N-acetylglucosaminyl deacetylase
MIEQKRTILVVVAHAGDMEVSCGAVLAKHARHGDSVTLLHLTLGEGGNPRLSPKAYAVQKRAEAKRIARAMGASVIIGPYKDGELMNTEAHQRYVAEVIRSVKPTHVITHWKNSIHKDHANTHSIVMDAILLASLEGVKTRHPRHRGVKAIYFSENWEDPEGFTPYVFVDVNETFDEWRSFASLYEFIKGGISSFPYLEYYSALSVVRGAVVGRRHAVAFDVDPFEKKETVDLLT